MSKRHLHPLLPPIAAPRRARLARGDGTYSKVVERLARIWLLILDDRNARRGTILFPTPRRTLARPVGDPTFGDAILDRLLNSVHAIALKGASIRRPYDSTTAGENQ